MSAAAPAPVVRTVLGDVDPATLGPTLCHEHLLCAPPAWAQADDDDMALPDLDRAVAELADLAEAGGGALVEMTTPDYGRDAAGLAAVASRSRVQVVAASGYQKGIYYPDTVHTEDASAIADRFVADVLVGMDGTEVRAGVIKFGSCRTDAMLPEEELVLAATALAHRRTGAPVSTHTQAGHLGLEQVAGLVEHGVPASSILIGHLDRNLDLGYLREVAATGVWLGFDHWTKPKYPSDELRVECVTRLLDEGFTRIMAAGDLGRPSYQPAYGGAPGFAGILRQVSARLGAEVAELVFTSNPARFLAFSPRDEVVA